MEILISLLLFIVVAWIVLKLFAVFFHVGILMIAFPFKILGLVFVLLLIPLILVPLGLFAGLAGILLAPLALILPLLPVLIIAIGIWLLLKNA